MLPLVRVWVREVLLWLEALVIGTCGFPMHVLPIVPPSHLLERLLLLLLLLQLHQTAAQQYAQRLSH